MLKSLLRRAGDEVTRDADHLMREMGDQAFAVAGDMSWREDAGLLHSRKPGHWGRVQAEVGRRSGRALPVREIRMESMSGQRAA